jgi:hypothetical protein
MGSGLSEIVGFFYLWPLVFLSIIAVGICVAFTEAEYDDGALTSGGKRMIRSRVFLSMGCTAYCLCIVLGHALTGNTEQEFGVWDRHWHLFLILVSSAEVSMLIAMIYGFQARGTRSWLIKIATTVVAILSTFEIFLFLSVS